MRKLDGLVAGEDLASSGARRRIEISDGLIGLMVAIADFVLVAGGIALADILYHQHLTGWLAGSAEGRSAAIFVGSLFVAIQSLQRAYGVQACLDLRRQLRFVLLGWCAVFFVVGWAAFLMKITTDYSRAVLTLSFVAGPVLLIGLRIAISVVLRRGLARGGIALRRAFLLYAGDEAQRRRIVREAARNGVEIAGCTQIDADDHKSAPGHAAQPAGGGLDESARVLEAVRAAYQTGAFDEIYLYLPWERWRPLSAAMIALNQVPLPVYLFGTEDMNEVLRARALSVGRFTGFEVQRSPLSGAELRFKRVLDMAVAGTALLLLSPLLLLVTVAIMVESGRPVIFRQSRKGFGSRSFTIFKFRTMRVCEDGPAIAQATRNDARVTRLGAVLRRTSVDELPQLINVLRGEMSIVGPRPHAIAHDHHYDALIATYAYRHHAKPGLTGWAQVNGLRGETRELSAMEDRVKHDIWYINNWSIWLDIQIIVRTAATLLGHKHAY